MADLINKRKAREYALSVGARRYREASAAAKHYQVKQVAAEMYPRWEHALKKIIEADVLSARPGRTLKAE